MRDCVDGGRDGDDGDCESVECPYVHLVAVCGLCDHMCVYYPNTLANVQALRTRMAMAMEKATCGVLPVVVAVPVVTHMHIK